MIFNIPNLISLLRGLGVPLFLWVYLGLHSQSWALLILILGGLSDYLDGKIARAFNQMSKLGEKLDPAIDRLYLLAILLAFGYEKLLPYWVVSLIVGRDLILAILIAWRRKIPTVTFLGKAATFNLLYALPILLLNQYPFMRTLGWAFAIWGIGLYLLTGFTYGRLVLKR